MAATEHTRAMHTCNHQLAPAAICVVYNRTYAAICMPVATLFEPTAMSMPPLFEGPPPHPLICPAQLLCNYFSIVTMS